MKNLNHHQPYYFRFKSISKGIAWLLLSCTAVLSHAHHAMGGEAPKTALKSLLSGLAHPILGVDHLVFVLAIGVAAALFSLPLLNLACLFMMTCILGLALHFNAANILFSDLLIALIILMTGIIFIAVSQHRLRLLTVLFGTAGIVHGYAYAESMIGAEWQHVGAYLLGLIAIQTVLVLFAAWGTQKLTQHYHLLTERSSVYAGTAMSFIGMLLIVSTLV